MKTTFLSSLVHRNPRFFAVLALLVGIFTLGVIMLNSVDWELLADERAIRSISVSDNIRSVASELGLNRKGKAVLFASNPQLQSKQQFNSHCGKDGELLYTAGCYYLDNNKKGHIEILDIDRQALAENDLNFDFNAQLQTTILHETLHAIWERRSSTEKAALCNDLNVLSQQIISLKTSVSHYGSAQLCSELFARVGSEYFPIESSHIIISHNATDALQRLGKVYASYFDTSKTKRVKAYWRNQEQLEKYASSLDDDKNALDRMRDTVIASKKRYYLHPTRANYEAANRAVQNYNFYASIYNSRLNAYNKVYAVLDSERES